MTQQNDTRAAFEAWFFGDGVKPERMGGTYKLASAYSAWSAWQAASNLRADDGVHCPKCGESRYYWKGVCLGCKRGTATAKTAAPVESVNQGLVVDLVKGALAAQKAVGDCRHPEIITGAVYSHIAKLVAESWGFKAERITAEIFPNGNKMPGNSENEQNVPEREFILDASKAGCDLPDYQGNLIQQILFANEPALYLNLSHTNWKYLQTYVHEALNNYIPQAAESQAPAFSEAELINIISDACRINSGEMQRAIQALQKAGAISVREG